LDFNGAVNFFDINFVSGSVFAGVRPGWLTKTELAQKQYP